MSFSSFVVLGLLVAFALWCYRDGAQLPKRFKSRSCQGAAWRRAFPRASKEEIRSFLSIFVEAFAFKENQRLKFNPDDRILSVYQSLYPHKWQPDALELETLANSVEKNYGVKFSELWQEGTTLGQLFSAVRSTRPGAR